MTQNKLRNKVEIQIKTLKCCEIPLNDYIGILNTFFVYSIISVLICNAIFNQIN